MPDIDSAFLALPRDELAAAALGTAAELGAEHADFRLEQLRGQEIRVRDGLLQGVADTTDVGMAVRVVHRGAWGFASGVVLTVDAAARLARVAVSVAEVAAAMTDPPVELAPEPVHQATWVSAYDLDPFAVPLPERVDLLRSWSAALLRAPGVELSKAYVEQVRENKHYADLSGTVTTQQRVRTHPVVEVFGSDAQRGVAD